MVSGTARSPGWAGRGGGCLPGRWCAIGDVRPGSAVLASAAMSSAWLKAPPASASSCPPRTPAL